MNEQNLHPGALEAAAKELFLEEENTAYVSYPEWDSPENIGKESYIEIARAVVTAYLSALPAQPDRFDSRELNRQGWHCGLCEPGEYENCHHCAKACDDLADFLNRNYPAPSDTVNSVEEIPAKIQTISWEEEPEHECWKLAPDETFVGLIVKADRSWSPADQYTLNIIHRPVEG